MQLGLSLGACPFAGADLAPRPVIGLAGPPRIALSAATGRYALEPVTVLGPAAWSLAYQWERDAVPLPGATAPDYAPAAQDAGRQIRLLLRVFSPGYIALAAYSNALSSAAAGWTIEQAMILSAPAAPAAPTLSGSYVEV